MMPIFLIDQETVFTYDYLLKDINNAIAYYPMFRTINLYDFFLNFVISLASNKPIVLIDSDLNNSEIEGINEKSVNLAYPIKQVCFSSIEEIVKCIQVSKSEISIYTSGTTGQPKKVVHTVSTLTRYIRVSDRYAEQIWGFAYNPTHMAGVQVFFQAFENINTIVNVFNKNRQQVYDSIDKYGITHISATPTFFRLLLPIEKTYDSIKRVTLGGEKSDNKLYEFILQIFPGAKINNIYASTEAGSLFVANGENFRIPANIIDKIKIKDNELMIHKSLLGKSDSFNFQGEYFFTNDLIEWTNKEEGLFRFVSRKNELINVGGYKVNPLEVESVIQQLPDVIQVMVYGKANSVLGNVLCAEVKLQEFSALSEFSIRQYLSEKLQDFKIPRKIKFVNFISLTRTGKIKRL